MAVWFRWRWWRRGCLLFSRLWWLGGVEMEKRREKKRGPATLLARKSSGAVALLISPEQKVRRYDGFVGEDEIEAERCEAAMD
ncbi:hypothetical protein HAX54_049235 [Datura stramonium]|uniref:Secreted protein n=1 Tax=Datura stramonium TaxID=4076 RepID=A0ABS8WP41_DATST|nr:hypothetical protein [Datura stramonium]